MSVFGRPRATQRYALYRKQANEGPEVEPLLLASSDCLAGVLNYQLEHYGSGVPKPRIPAMLEVFDWETGITLFWTFTHPFRPRSPGPPH